jgi:hypothetical protein
MNHPYVKHENTPLWVLLDSELAELEANGDVRLTTAREYVVGALCDRIEPLHGRPGGSELRAWRALRAANWPPDATEVERFEIAMAIEGVIRSGTAEHVADALRSFVPLRHGGTRSTEELLRMARLLIAAESSAIAEDEDGDAET